MPIAVKRPTYSKTWTFFDGDWHEGNVAIMGPRSHGAWLGSTIFDGARKFEGVSPDLDLHLARTFYADLRRRMELFFEQEPASLQIRP